MAHPLSILRGRPASVDCSQIGVCWMMLYRFPTTNIAFSFGDSHCNRMGRYTHYPRWNTNTLDRELFGEIIIWLSEGSFPVESVEGFSLHIANIVSMACDVSAKRLRYHSKRRVYWWSEEVSQVRRRYIAVRRLLTRKRRCSGQYTNLEELYKKTRAILCKKIKKNKVQVMRLTY